MVHRTLFRTLVLLSFLGIFVGTSWAEHYPFPRPVPDPATLDADPDDVGDRAAPVVSPTVDEIGVTADRDAGYVVSSSEANPTSGVWVSHPALRRALASGLRLLLAVR